MKRLMVIGGIGLGLGCGATQGDGPDPAPPQPAPVATAASADAIDAGVRKLEEPFERRLFPQKFSATSHLENDWNKFQENYLAEYLGDDNPETGWTEGKEDVGLGERVTIDLTPLDDVSNLRLEVRNGYQKRDELFKRNARAKEIVVKRFPSGEETTHTLKDSQGWQTVSIDMPSSKLTGYSITFTSVYPGSKYEDLVISDIQTYVTSRTPDNPGFEASKQKRLLDWIAERKLAAKTFKEAAQGSMPVAANYKEQAIGNAAEDCYHDCPLPFDRAAKAWGEGTPRFGALAAAAEEKFQGWKQVRLSMTDERPVPQADNFRFPGSWWKDVLMYEGDEPVILLPSPKKMAFFNAKSLKRVYVEKGAILPEKALLGTAPGCRQEGKETRHYFTPDEEGALRTLLIAGCGLFEDRDGYTPGQYWQLVEYAEDGSLAYLFDFFTASKFEWTKTKGAPLLTSVTRLSTAGAQDTRFTAK